MSLESTEVQLDTGTTGKEKSKGKQPYERPVMRVVRDEGIFYAPSSLTDWACSGLHRGYGPILNPIDLDKRQTRKCPS
jgi:hypothetical protein